MLKTRKKWISILLTLAMLVGLMVPLAAPAMAASGYEALSIPNVDDNTVDNLGTVFMEVRAGALENGDSVIFRLPSDFEFRQDATENGPVDTTTSFKNRLSVPNEYQDNINGLKDALLSVEKLDDNEFKVTVTNLVYNSSYDGYLYLNLNNIYIDEDFSGDIELTASAPSGSGFPKGSVVVGRVGGGKLDMAVVDDPTFTNDTDKTTDPITIRVEEDVKGTLDKGDESLKFVLPDGFEWQSFAPTDFSLIWGGWNTADGKPRISNDKADIGDTTYDLVIYNDEDELIVAVNNETAKAACFELTLGINVTDETDAEVGDVVAKVQGDSDFNQSELIVGHYGQYEATIATKGDVPTIYSGKFDQKIVDIVVKESVKESLVDGRTLILTLPDNARWGKVDEASDSGIKLEFQGFPGNDGKAAKWKVTATNGRGSTSAAELKLEDMEIIVEPGTNQDIVVEVSGTAGLDGELTVAKATPPVEIAASSKPNIKIGTVNEAGDLTITETKAGALSKDKDIILDLPEGVKWASKPQVEVTEGDLKLSYDGIKTQGKDGTDDNQLVIPVDRESTEPSTIKLTGVKLVADRSVPEGDIAVKVQGTAALQTKDTTEIEDYFGSNYHKAEAYVIVNRYKYYIDDIGNDSVFFDKTGTAAKTVVATVATPAPPDTKQTASFVIGSTTYTVNGVENTMDVAPYVTAAGRTYVPVRYLAYALGVSQENIYWDEATRTVTLLKGTTAIQLTIGSNVIKVNGVSLTMDVAPEIKDGRTMLPARFVAQALGATVGYDEANQTVTIEM